jgi:hypothetical protein
MKSRSQHYLASVVFILVLTAAAKLYSATGTAKVLDIPDALLPMTIRQALWLLGLVELAVAAYVAFGKTEKIKLVCVAWLGGNFLLYRVAAALLAVGKPCPCLGSITEKLPLSRSTLDVLLWLAAVYLFCGSMFLLLARREQPESGPLAAGKLPLETT